MHPTPLTFATYQAYGARFGVERVLVRETLARCEPLAVEALSVYALQHLWQGELPIYPVMTTPAQNGGWGHLMPVWFRPHERPLPLHTLENWALFALMYAHSFGPSAEAGRLTAQVFSRDNLVRVVIGTNLLIPFLPSTQGRGLFFRHGMLPFLLAILWLGEEARQPWLRLHELGAAQFIAAHELRQAADPAAALAELEFAIFGAIERNSVTDDAAVAALLAAGPGEPATTAVTLRLYRDLFGAICLGVATLASYYQRRSLDAWRSWAPQEIGVDYRLSDYGLTALRAYLQRQHV
jgi:hypothetical protein